MSLHFCDFRVHFKRFFISEFAIASG
jgi:hypothetical protein